MMTTYDVTVSEQNGRSWQTTVQADNERDGLRLAIVQMFGAGCWFRFDGRTQWTGQVYNTMAGTPYSCSVTGRVVVTLARGDRLPRTEKVPQRQVA